MNPSNIYQPHTIYTRLNDVFEEDANFIKEDFAPDNFIKPTLIGKVIEENQKELEKKLKQGSNKYKDNHINKYVNKELVESWIEAIKESKKNSKLK